MKALHKLGLGLFLLGLLLFVSSLFLGRFQLEAAVVEQAVKQTTGIKLHTEYILEATTEMRGQSYSNAFSFVSDLDAALQTVVQSSQSKEQPLPSYRTKPLKFWLTKASSKGLVENQQAFFFWGSLLLCCLGALLYFVPLARSLPGIKNNGIYQNSATNGGSIGIAVGAFLIAFYILLYFYPEYMTNWVLLVDPLSYSLTGGPASQWFFYGFLYTLVIAVMGIRMFFKYRHNKYQLYRTASVIFFQTGFAFLLPNILAELNGMDLKNAWPLDYDYFYDYNINQMLAEEESNPWGPALFVWGIALSFIVIPALAYFWGKRWYCSWVCGCGGLAETLGDPYRQLSDKRLKAWKVERYVVHGVLVFAILMTGLVLADYWTQDAQGGSILGGVAGTVRTIYGFAIGAIFAGVVGTGFYPFMGNRVWCRFGCPLAAILGIVQRYKSRFRITTNGGQCISCGNCSAYCEMGIDVRWYAQRGQDIVRASCVGCGICSAVCPRGVLRLENSSVDVNSRAQEQRVLHISKEGVHLEA